MSFVLKYTHCSIPKMYVVGLHVTYWVCDAMICTLLTSLFENHVAVCVRESERGQAFWIYCYVQINNIFMYLSSWAHINKYAVICDGNIYAIIYTFFQKQFIP